jgi:signal transduction histidine kinase
MLVLLTAYMVYVVMRPIRLLEKTLSTLDFKNIREKSTIEVPYREFKTLANVYRDLLNRLYESYENAKRFASDAAHELKTPLSILRGNVERLIPETQHGTAVQGYVQNLSDEVDRLVLITEKLLMLSRADSNNLALDLTPFNLSVFLNELIEDASTFHPHLQFINHVQPDVVWRCDHALIEQLINNLYTNAVKYNTPRGGWIAIHLQQTDTDIVLQFKNSSADVSPELPQKAFERFYRSDASRTRRKVDGLGLGLSICKEIAQAHGGTMQLTVEDDHVVSIELRAPLQPAHP